MEIEIFRLLWMLFIHRIHTIPIFTLSVVNPEIHICYRSLTLESRPTWTIEVELLATETELNDFKDSIDVGIILDYDNPRYLCSIIIGNNNSGVCPPQDIPWDTDAGLSCYCSGSSGPDLHNLSITRKAYLEENGGMLWINFPFIDYQRILPVNILAKTCFHDLNSVNSSDTLWTGDIWNAEGYLNVAHKDISYYVGDVQVELGNLPFCTIDLRECPPARLPTGDIICYCQSREYHKQFNHLLLKVTATAQGSQSQGRLTAALLSRSGFTGCAAIRGTFGTLPTIKEGSRPKSEDTTTTLSITTATSRPTVPPTTTEENRTKKNSTLIWLMILLLFLGAFCICVLFFVLIKIRGEKKKNGLENKYL